MLPIEWQVRFYLNLNFLAVGILTTITGIYMMRFYSDKNKDIEEEPLQGNSVKVEISELLTTSVQNKQRQVILEDQIDRYKFLKSKKFIQQCFTYGLIPFLQFSEFIILRSVKTLLEDTLHQYIEIHPISLDLNYLLSVIAFILILVSFSIVQTLSDQNLLKTDWDYQCIHKTLAITLWIVLYCLKFLNDHYQSIILLNYLCFSFSIVLIQISATLGIYLVTSLKVQKYLQNSPKFE